jgi:hypothetical protein
MVLAPFEGEDSTKRSIDSPSPTQYSFTTTPRGDRHGTDSVDPASKRQPPIDTPTGSRARDVCFVLNENLEEGGVDLRDLGDTGTDGSVIPGKVIPDISMRYR